jgi:ubiquinone/menaquinone biosynthesis C-methylase UbiE
VIPVDFNDEANSLMYASREASLGWRILLTNIRDPTGLRTIDLGCGGGIYTRALREMGAGSVTGVDVSVAMLSRARETCAQLDHVEFVQAPADAVPLPGESADMILARGLIHHFDRLDGFAKETWRLLAPGGTLVIQDRTPDDVVRPPGPENIRGYYFERFPQLREIDLARRYSTEEVHAALENAGFELAPDQAIDEVRTIHEDRAAYAEQMRARSGRSILHELDEEQLSELVSYILERIPATGPIVDQDRWTIWVASKP